MAGRLYGRRLFVRVPTCEYPLLLAINVSLRLVYCLEFLEMFCMQKLLTIRIYICDINLYMYVEMSFLLVNK
jgi:hypothetical protein